MERNPDTAHSPRTGSHTQLLLALAAAAAAACGSELSLRVEVAHPAGYTVAETVVSVYESELVSCERVELGDLGAEQLQAALVDEDRIAALDGASDGLAGISRTETKVIVARGYDSSGTFVTAGCAEHGVVTGADVVAIATVPTATVSVFGAASETDPAGLVVTLTDPLVQSIDRRRVAWRVFGPAGTAPYVDTNVTAGDAEWVPTAAACTNQNGVARIHPVPPSLISGFATQVRAAWSSEPPRLFTTFTNLNLAATEITAVAGSLRWCAPRVATGVRRLVCLEQRVGQVARDFEVTVVDGAAILTERQTQPFPGLAVDENVIALYSIERGALRDVYALTNRARVIGVFAPSVAPVPGARLTAPDAASDVIVMPACGAGAQPEPAQLLIRVASGALNQAQVMAVTGGPLAAYQATPAPTAQPFTLNQSGCITELGGVPTFRQVGVLDFGRGVVGGDRNATVAYFRCDAPGGDCSVVLPVPRAGVGFLPGPEPRMVGAFFDASGTVLSEWVLQPDITRTSRLVELGRITAAAFPAHLVVGRFDDDDQPDLFWDIPNPATASSNFQISYFRPVGDDRLSALSGVQDDTLVVDTFVAEVTGDGRDDLVLTRVDAAVGPTRQSVVVVPTGVAPAAYAPALDTPCPP